MEQLQVLEISDTDLTSGVEYLLPSIMEITCSYLEKTDSEVKLIVKELKKSSDFISIKSFSQIYLKKKLNSELLSQIKDFNHKVLTSNQETLLEKLITGEA